MCPENNISTYFRCINYSYNVSLILFNCIPLPYRIPVKPYNPVEEMNGLAADQDECYEDPNFIPRPTNPLYEDSPYYNFNPRDK